MTKIEPHVDQFLSQTLVGVISTVDAQGRPCSAPIWYQWEDGAAYFFTGRRTLKWRNLLREPHASLCVDWREPPYKSVILSGVVEEVDRPLYDLVLSMAVRYYGEEEGKEVRGELSRRAIGLGHLPADSDASGRLYGGRLAA